MSSDPSGFVSNPPSTYVKIVNTARAEINGQFGLVLGYSAERSRYVLLLCQNGSQAMLRPENLEPASTVEKYQAQYQHIRNDPRVRQKIAELYGKSQRALGGQKPEHAAGIAGVLFFALSYKIGFTKMVMLISLVLLLGVVVFPDVQAFGIKRWKLILRNFPNRCRETIEATVPQARGRITNQIAMGLVVLLLLVSGRTLFAPATAAVRPPAAVAADVVPPARSSGPRTTTGLASTAAAAIEEAYKLGHDDAASGRPFGTASLAALKERASGATAAAAASEPRIDYDYSPPPLPPPQKSGGFGFGSAMSLFMIGRTAVQNGMSADGNFDPQLLLANLRIMPLPQKAVLGFSAFNLLRAFL